MTCTCLRLRRCDQDTYFWPLRQVETSPARNGFLLSQTSNATAKPRLPRRDVFATVTRFLRPLPRWERRRRVTFVPEPRVPSQRYRKRMNVILATFEEPRGHGHQSTRLPMARPFNEATLPVAIPLSPASAKLVEKETADPLIDWGDYRPPVPVGRKLGIIFGGSRREVPQPASSDLVRPAAIEPPSAPRRSNRTNVVPSHSNMRAAESVRKIRTDICGAIPIRPSIVPTAAPPVQPAAVPLAMAPVELPPPTVDGTRTGRDVDRTVDMGRFNLEGQFNLEGTSPVVDAPSIGPRTAERLEAVGIHTVNDLLVADPQLTAEILAYRQINAKTIVSWQQQAKLVCQIPNLRGHDAQVLVACGFYDIADLAGQDPRDVFRVVGPFVATKKGQRLLRSARKPDLDEVTNWVKWSASKNTPAAA
jgi:hypothetical protein